MLYAINVAPIESNPIRLLTWPLYVGLKSSPISLINSLLQSVQLVRNAQQIRIQSNRPAPHHRIATINYLSVFPVDTTTVPNYKDIIENVGLSFDSPKYVRDVIPGVEAVFLGRSVAWCQRKAENIYVRTQYSKWLYCRVCVFLPDNKKENKTYFKKIKIDLIPKIAAAFGVVFIIYRKGPVKSVLSLLLFFSKLHFFFFILIYWKSVFNFLSGCTTGFHENVLYEDCFSLKLAHHKWQQMCVRNFAKYRQFIFLSECIYVNSAKDACR